VQQRFGLGERRLGAREGDLDAEGLAEVGPGPAAQAREPLVAAALLHRQLIRGQHREPAELDGAAWLLEARLRAPLDQPLAEHPVAETLAVGQQEVAALRRTLQQLLVEPAADRPLL